jgi:hypothetical protein
MNFESMETIALMLGRAENIKARQTKFKRQVTKKRTLIRYHYKILLKKISGSFYKI